MPRIGLGAGYVGFGEMPWASDGTAANITHWYRLAASADNLQASTDVIGVNAQMHAYDDDIGGKHEGHRHVTGSVRFPMTWRQLQNTMRFISGEFAIPINHGNGEHSWHFGFDPGTPPEPSSASNYVYGATKRGLCIEVFRGESGQSVFYQGCVITESHFEFAPNDFAMLTLTFVGRKVTTGAKSTPVHPTGLWGLIRNTTGQGPWKGGELLAGGGAAQMFCKLGFSTFRAVSASFTISTPVETRFDVGDTFQTAQPMPNGKRAVQMLVEFESDGLLDQDEAIQSYAQKPISTPIRLPSAQLFVDEHPYTTPNFPYPDAIWGMVEPVIVGPVEPHANRIGVLRPTWTLRAFRPNAITAGWLMGVRNDQNAYM